MSRLLLWEEEKLKKTHLVGQDGYGRKRSWGRLTWVARMSRLLLWEEEKLGKTHLVGQDVKAPVLGGREDG
jgi:hypothetical protein